MTKSIMLHETAVHLRSDGDGISLDNAVVKSCSSGGQVVGFEKCRIVFRSKKSYPIGGIG